MADFEVEPFVVPEGDLHPALIAEPLLLLHEHQHLKDGEARIDWLLRTDAKIKGGRQVLGTAHMPSVQGELKDCFEWMLINLLGRMPDFLIILDRAYWLDSPPIAREILVYHELKHCTQKVDGFGTPRFHRDGTPMWGLIGHDVEEFSATVRRYGAYSDEIQKFIEAATEGNANRL